MNKYNVYIDTETGVLDPSRHSLLQVGIVIENCDDNKVVLRREWFIKDKEYNTTPQAMDINKLSIEEIDRVGVSFTQFTQEFEAECLKYFDKLRSVEFVGQNTIFDISFLKENYIKNNLKYSFSHRYLDIMSISRFMVDTGFIKVDNLKLDSIVDHLNNNFQKAKYYGQLKDLCMDSKDSRHTAVYDCELTMVVYNIFKEIVKK